MLFGEGLDHVLEKAWRSAVVRHRIEPVHLELPVGILVVVLVGPSRA